MKTKKLSGLIALVSIPVMILLLGGMMLWEYSTTGQLSDRQYRMIYVGKDAIFQIVGIIATGVVGLICATVVMVREFRSGK